MSLPAHCPYCGASAMEPPVIDPPEERITYPCGTVVWSVRGIPWRDGNGRQSDRCREAAERRADVDLAGGIGLEF